MTSPPNTPVPYPLTYCEPGPRNGQPVGTIYLWDSKLSSPDFCITADEATTIIDAPQARGKQHFFVATRYGAWESCKYPAPRTFVGSSDMPAEVLLKLGLAQYQVARIKAAGGFFRISLEPQGWQLNGRGFAGYKLQTEAEA